MNALTLRPTYHNRVIDGRLVELLCYVITDWYVLFLKLYCHMLLLSFHEPFIVLYDSLHKLNYSESLSSL